jgi:hypothetical protein
MIKKYILLVFVLSSVFAYAQKGKESYASTLNKRKLSKAEIKVTANAIDSIKHNLNRMIMFEKELHQRNYYLNEKTTLVEELISIVKSLKQSLEVVEFSDADIKNMFGKPSHKTETVMLYEIETYQSNCPFMQITFYIQQRAITKLEYQITDCQRWK